VFRRLNVTYISGGISYSQIFSMLPS
jgi:hypothetical protein